LIHNNKDYEDLRGIAISSLDSLIINDFCQIGMANWLIMASSNYVDSTNSINLIDHEIIDVVANMLY